MENPTRVTGASGSTLPYVEFGYTEGDAAGEMYLSVPSQGIIFFTPAQAPALFDVQKQALTQATADAQSKKVTISVTPTMTDAQIVAAVKAKLT